MNYLFKGWFPGSWLTDPSVLSSAIQSGPDRAGRRGYREITLPGPDGLKIRTPFRLGDG
jgi:hypothetical protein